MEYTYDSTYNNVFNAEEGQQDYKRHNQEMNVAWQFISRTDMSVFLTGKAGTGKTTFLKRLRELMPKRMVVLAPTGVAAINAGGQTIHSFFQLPFGPFIPGKAPNAEATKKAFKMAQYKKDLIRTLDLLVIDEVSMVRADLLDQIDDALRRYRDRTKPFGGVQLLLIGDLMQLSPVAKSAEWDLLSPYYDTPYFFSSHALQQKPYVTIELQHIYRQQDNDFIDLLAKVRDGKMTKHEIDMLNSRFMPQFNADGPGWIRLTTHNHIAQQYNDSRLAQLPGETYKFEAKVKGDFPESSYPADLELSLRIGAQVMFIKNDPSIEHLYYNGKIGTVTDLTDTTVEVTCPGDPKPIDVNMLEWENIKYSIDPETKAIQEDTVGEFWQVPLRLAWAITVHKSQGLTFDRAVLDINASFAHGQAYVALSRCRTLEGIVLSSPMSAASVITDVSVNYFISKELSASEDNVKALPALMQQYTLTLLDELYNFSNIAMDVQWLTRVVDEHLGHQQQALLTMLRTADMQLQQDVTAVGVRFRSQYYASAAETGGRIAGTPLEGRIKDSCKYFIQKLEDIFEDLLKEAVAIRIGNKQTAETYKNALTALRQSLSDKMQILQCMAEKEFSTTNYLNVKAQVLLGTSKPNAFSTKHSKSENTDSKQPQKSKKKVIKGGTALMTLQMFEEGLSPAQIAEKRGLVVGTIWAHLAALIADNRIDINRLIDPARQEVIREALKKRKDNTLSSVKEFLPEDYNLNEVRALMAADEMN